MKVNFCVWVKLLPLARMWSEGVEPLKACSRSDRSEVERGPKSPSAEGSAAECSCSSTRLRSRISFLERYSCSTTRQTHQTGTTASILYIYIYLITGSRLRPLQCFHYQIPKHTMCGHVNNSAILTRPFHFSFNNTVDIEIQWRKED